MRNPAVQACLRFYSIVARRLRFRVSASALTCSVIALTAVWQASLMLARPQPTQKHWSAADHSRAPLGQRWLNAVLAFFSWPVPLEQHLHSYSSTHAGLLPGSGRRREAMTVVSEVYPELEDWEQQFVELVRNFPHLATLQHIGKSTARRHPIMAIRLSDHPERDEDEPAVLFTALHHAREPAGIFICQAIIQELLMHYGADGRYTRLLDSLDIWFVPMVNPDGYAYIMENQRQFPWWRKNLRDNDHDGRFDPLVDGVDLNRNYDYNWGEGGDGDTGSWFYRGEAAFSEAEIQALRDLEARRNFVLGVSFHSYGEAVLYPWGNFHRAPDQDLILEIARQYASRIGRLSGKNSYNVLPLNGRVGQSSVWMYGTGGVIDFICETGEEYFPPADDLLHLTRENVKGALFLLERALCSGLSGHVVDAATGAPLEAEIVIRGYERDYVRPRRSHPDNGRFDRLLLPGAYEVQVQCNGYLTARFDKVEVHATTLTRLEVALQREAEENVMGNE